MAYTLAGKKTAKFLSWLFVTLFLVGLIVGSLTGLRPAIESLDWVSERFSGERFAWGSFIYLLGQFVLFALILLFSLLIPALVLVVGFGYLPRISLAAGTQRRLDQTLERLDSALADLIERNNALGSTIHPFLDEIKVLKEKRSTTVVGRILAWTYWKREYGRK